MGTLTGEPVAAYEGEPTSETVTCIAFLPRRILQIRLDEAAHAPLRLLERIA
jgi:hypothetical protein